LIHQCSRETPDHIDGTWLPNQKQISDLEAKLPHALAEALERQGVSYDPKFEIKRQYAGLLVSGRKIIYVNAFPGKVIDFDGTNLAPWKESSWHVKPVNICDGGARYFSTEYFPDIKAFEHFEFNGPG